MFDIPNLRYSELEDQLQKGSLAEKFYFATYLENHLEQDLQTGKLEVVPQQLVDNQPAPAKTLIVQDYPQLVDWNDAFTEMLSFTTDRDEDFVDQVLFLEHLPALTLGIAADKSHILNNWLEIPVYEADRGGQVTYHGPKQQIIYLLVDFFRKKKNFDGDDFKLYSRNMITLMEQAVVAALANLGIPNVHAKPDAPGIYVEEKKISSLGLKITKHGSYHGIAINLDMSLIPFKMINPCGYAGLEMCNLYDYKDQYGKGFEKVVNQLTPEESQEIFAQVGPSDDQLDNEELISVGNILLTEQKLYKILRQFIKEYFIKYMQLALGYETVIDGERLDTVINRIQANNQN